MPNHFHFLIYAAEKTIQTKKIGGQQRNVLSEGFRNLLSSYAQAINRQNKAVGSLFQQNTKSKCLRDGNRYYGPTCFHYIHQNPWKARLVRKMEQWKYSSFNDYAGFRNGTLSNRELAFQLLDLDPDSFYKDSYKIIDDDTLNNIW